jgi:DNA repair ATPase RecN
MTPEERFERIEADLTTAAGLLMQAGDRLDQAGDRLDAVDKRLDRISARLDRAVRLAIREALDERGKRREMDTRVSQQMEDLRAAQKSTEQALKAFIDSLRRGGNGHA